jgi:hypothetical protein
MPSQFTTASTPTPPGDAIEAIEFSTSDKIYYLRYGLWTDPILIGFKLLLTNLNTGKWRMAEVAEFGGSSEDSRRYLVRDVEICGDDEADIERFAMRKQNRFKRYQFVI